MTIEYIKIKVNDVHLQQAVISEDNLPIADSVNKDVRFSKKEKLYYIFNDARWFPIDLVI